MKAPDPPNLRNSQGAESCATCTMFYQGACWGFGNRSVKPTEVCDNYARDPGAAPEASMKAGTESLEWRRERAAALSEIQRKRSDSRQTVADLELREASDNARTLRSYASLFDMPYTIGGGGHRFEEVVRPGAFKRSLGSGPDVVFRAEHSGPPLARTSSGTLRLGEDERGLWYEADLNLADPDVQALIPKIERGDLRESSFAFRVMGEHGDEWNEDCSQRELLACDINRGDVSIVTFGASPSTGRHMILRSALEDLGLEMVLQVRKEFQENEERLGAMISSNSMATLQRVLDLIADADDAVDEAQPMLANMMGVPNPDADDDDGRSEEDPEYRDYYETIAKYSEEMRRDFSAADRKKLAKSGAALPDGSFPIVNVQDLKNAIQAVGRASNPAAAKAHIKKRAAALGATNLLPDSWRSVSLAANDTDEMRLEWQLTKQGLRR